MRKILFALLPVAAVFIIIFACNKDTSGEKKSTDSSLTSNESADDRSPNCFVNFRITNITSGSCSASDFYAVLTYYERNVATGQTTQKCMKLTSALTGPVTVSIAKNTPYTIVHHYKNDYFAYIETRINLENGIGSGYDDTQYSTYDESCKSGCDQVVEQTFGGTISTSCSIQNASHLSTCTSCSGTCNTDCSTVPQQGETSSRNCLATFDIQSSSNCSHDPNDELYVLLRYQYYNSATSSIEYRCLQFTQQFSGPCDIQIMKGSTFYILHHFNNGYSSFIDSRFNMGSQNAYPYSDYNDEEGCDLECSDVVEHVFTGTVGGNGQTTAICSFTLDSGVWYGECTANGVYQTPLPYGSSFCVSQCPF